MWSITRPLLPRAARRRTARACAVVLCCGLLLSACSTRTQEEPSAGPSTVAPVLVEQDGRVRVRVGALEGIPDGDDAVPRGAIHVAPDGDDAASGGRDDPVATVAAAVEVAEDGATILLEEGTYRESVEINRSDLTIRAAPGARVWFDGADPVDGFVQDGEGAWVHSGWDPAPERLAPDSHLLTDEDPTAGWPDMVFLDGVELREAASRVSLDETSFWIDRRARAIVLGADPTGRSVEAARREWGMYLDGAHDVTIEGIGFRRFATPARLIAPLRVHADRVVVRNVTVEDNAYAGISVMGSDVIVDQLTATRNGQLGLQARHADGLLLVRCLLSDNNTQRFDAGQQAGGAKITASRDVVVQQCLASTNDGSGVWLDQSVLGATITSTVAAGNARSGLMVELSAQVELTDNLVVDNVRNGIYVLESSEVRVVHNTVVGNRGRGIWIVEGERDPRNSLPSDVDDRGGTPDPALGFDVDDVVVRANVVADRSVGSSSMALVGVEDATGTRAASSMGIVMDANRYWRSPGDAVFSTWANHPGATLVSADLEEHQEVTGQDRESTAGDGEVNSLVSGAGADTTTLAEGSAGVREDTVLPTV